MFGKLVSTCTTNKAFVSYDRISGTPKYGKDTEALTTRTAGKCLRSEDANTITTLSRKERSSQETAYIKEHFSNKETRDIVVHGNGRGFYN